MLRCIVTREKENIYAETESSNVHKFYLQQNNLQHNLCLYELWYRRVMFFATEAGPLASI